METSKENKTKLVGSHYVLATLPIWATAAILVFILLAVFIGRDILEGLPYDIAYASLVGDFALMIVALISATILHRNELKIGRWLQIPAVHVAILAGSILLGILVSFVTLNLRSGQLMDIYHDVIIGPLFLYLGITLLPVIFKNGTKKEIIASLCFILLWASLVGFDIRTDRMNQREWLQNHGVTFTQNL